MNPCINSSNNQGAAEEDDMMANDKHLRDLNESIARRF